MNVNLIIRRVVWLVVLAGILAAAWYFLVSHAYLKVTLSGVATGAEVSDGTGNTVARPTASGWLHLPAGDYTVTYFKGDQTTDVQLRHVGPFSFQTVTPTAQVATSHAAMLMNQPIDMVTPLGSGYLYLNRTNHGIYYSDAHTSTDLSAKFNLSSDPNASLIASTTTLNNTVVSIAATTGNGAVVTTTRGAFKVVNPLNIIQLPNYTHDDLNYVAGAYDAQTNSLFVLSAYSPAVYRYDLSSPSAAPTVTYNGTKQLNRLAAGGGKVVVYDDNLPNTDPAVVATYAVKRQITPLVINAVNGNVLAELSGYTPETYVSVSGSGRYLALKRKFADHMVIYDTTNAKTVSLPSYDTAGVGWRGDILYLGRSQALWSYDATGAQSGLTKIADTGAPITYLGLSESSIVLATNQGAADILEPVGQNTAAGLVPPAASAQNYIYYGAPSD